VAKKAKANKLGAWSFLIGVILAIILGLFGPTGTAGDIIVGILVILGIVVGLFNVGNEESSKVMIAGTVLVIVSFMGKTALAVGLGNVAYVGGAIQGILDALVLLFVPATIIVALKSLFELAKD
jgi:hypothetical protein